MHRLILFVFAGFFCSLSQMSLTAKAENVQAAADSPNIIIVLVDDMGFSDVGCYGGEIETPNIDKLAAGGLRFTQFYNAGRCCPTRASLRNRETAKPRNRETAKPRNRENGTVKLRSNDR